MVHYLDNDRHDLLLRLDRDIIQYIIDRERLRLVEIVSRIVERNIRMELIALKSGHILIINSNFGKADLLPM